MAPAFSFLLMQLGRARRRQGRGLMVYIETHGGDHGDLSPVVCAAD